MPENQVELAQIPLLRFLPTELRSVVADSFVPVSFGFGSPIVHDGDDADAFFVLTSGRARVLKIGPNGEEVPLNVLRPGDSFGEIGLLNDATRTATVRASSDVEAMRLDRAVFKALLGNHPEIRSYFELQTKHRRLQGFLLMHSAFAKLPHDALGILLEGLEPVAVERGTLVMREGDEPGPMYVVEEGRLRLFTEQDGHRKYLAYLRSGDFFGEMSLFTNTKRAASAEAVSPCKLLRLPEATFRTLIEGYPDFRNRLEEQIAQYDYKNTARVPLDFSEEALPAAVEAYEKVSTAQVDQVDERPSDAVPEGEDPFASPEGYFIKRPRRKRKAPHVYQVDEMDCGAAALTMICRFYGRNVSQTRIRKLVHTSVDGTSLRGICRAAQELGLAARAIKCSPALLDRMPLPAVLHWGSNHWVVLYDIDKNKALVGDPGVGLRRVKRSELESEWSGFAALFDYTTEFERAPESQPTMRWLLPFFRPFTGNLATALGLATVVSALEMVLPIFTQVIVDQVLVEKDVGLLNLIILSMVGVLVFMTVSMVVQRYLLSFSAVRIDAATLDFLTRKLLALPMNYFTTRRTGDIQRRIEGMREIRSFVVENLVAGSGAVLQILAALTLMFVYSPLLTAVFFVTAPLYAGLMYFSRHWLRPLFFDLEEAAGRYQSHQIDANKGIETVKATGAEGMFRELMLNQFLSISGRQFKADFTIMCYEAALQSVSFLSTTLFLLVSAQQVMAGSLSIGGLVAFNSLVAMANGPLFTLLSIWDGLQSASVLVNRLNDVFEQEPEQGDDRSRLLPVRMLEGHVTLRNLGFRYGGSEAPPILENITFDVPAGKMIAIVGRSGCGKTTLIKCLAGLLEPTEGTILYDGIDLKSLNYRDLRQRIGFVLQENYLFDDTIAKNIAFGADEPDMDRVVWAARLAHAHEFIDRLPLGFDTKVGESGLSLSGGQKQRIAIARSVYHDPPIMIFDEATSALDTESEKAIKQNMDAYMQGRTSFVIAHRLSTVRDADVIMVLEKGKLVEHGTHEELMERQGLYFYLCGQQLSL